MNPDDEEAIYRVLNIPARGLGAKAVQVLRETARERGIKFLAMLAEPDLASVSGLSRGAAEGAQQFSSIVDGIGAAASRHARGLVQELLETIDYRQEIERSYRDEQVRAARWTLALEVQKAWEAHLDASPGEGLVEFLDALALRARDDDGDSGSGVTLATVHAAKGLEFPCVYVVGVEDGIFPHARSVEDGRSLEEERRLFYVAVTRAQERLCFTRSRERTQRGKTKPSLPSRFLEDLPLDLLERRDLTAPAEPKVVNLHLERMRAMLK